MNDLTKYIMGVAAKSNVEKRQVGCVITWGDDIVSEGYNIQGEGVTPDVHAEIMALEVMIAEGTIASEDFKDLVLHVTHPPCPACAKAIASHGITKVKVIEAFMKFDGDKTRYDLVDGDFGDTLFTITPEDCSIERQLFLLERQLRSKDLAKNQKLATYTLMQKMVKYGALKAFEEVAEVLTFGARKYKPNNWRQCEDYGRYLAAAWRHHLAEDETDEESGLPHRAHFMTNIMFLHTKLVQIRDENKNVI
ncbi:dCMP deaminase [Pseudoalteromonas phage PH1]|uniref:dCMP deaminase n=1 Tax=Pseudoalteromonas phage PH1 TaxID=1874540 RepID=UPI0008199921|nr:dCMP deaminase [Pseudoalteromonas phage PH1]ANY29519.1 hypothetical protein [Pseudoalteromonas phage PH1]